MGRQLKDIADWHGRTIESVDSLHNLSSDVDQMVIKFCGGDYAFIEPEVDRGWEGEVTVNIFTGADIDTDTQHRFGLITPDEFAAEEERRLLYKIEKQKQWEEVDRDERRKQYERLRKEFDPTPTNKGVQS